MNKFPFSILKIPTKKILYVYVGGVVLFLGFVCAMWFFFLEKRQVQKISDGEICEECKKNFEVVEKAVNEKGENKYCKELDETLAGVAKLTRKEKINTILFWVEQAEEDNYEDQIVPDQRKVEIRQEWETLSDEKINEWYISFTGLAELYSNNSCEE